MNRTGEIVDARFGGGIAQSDRYDTVGKKAKKKAKKTKKAKKPKKKSTTQAQQPASPVEAQAPIVIAPIPVKGPVPQPVADSPAPVADDPPELVIPCGPGNLGRFVAEDNACRLPGNYLFRAAVDDPSVNVARRLPTRACSWKTPDKPFAYSNTEIEYAVRNLEARNPFPNLQRISGCCSADDALETGVFGRCRAIDWPEFFVPEVGTQDPVDRVSCYNDRLCIDPVNGLPNGACGGQLGDTFQLIQIASSRTIYTQNCCSGYATIVESIPAGRNIFARGQPVLAECIPHPYLKAFR